MFCVYMALLFCSAQLIYKFHFTRFKSPLPFSRRHYFPIINIEYAILASFNGFFSKCTFYTSPYFKYTFFGILVFKFYILVQFIFQNGGKCTGMPLIYNLKVSKWIENSDQMALVKNESVDNCNESNHEFDEYLHFCTLCYYQKKLLFVWYSHVCHFRVTRT